MGGNDYDTGGYIGYTDFVFPVHSFLTVPYTVRDYHCVVAPLTATYADETLRKLFGEVDWYPPGGT